MLNMNIILPIILIVLCLFSYKYVKELEQCPCFEENKTDKLNIDYIKFYLLLYIFSLLIHIFILLFMPVSSHKYVKRGQLYKSILMLSIIIMFIIHGYMGYSVYNFYQSIKDYCSCANKWQKYFIYYTGITSSLNVLFYIMIFLLILHVLIIQR
jgi:hypothetical protein